jgi:exonuclease III
MNGTGNADAKWAYLARLDADVSVLQEARLPTGLSGHVSRRRVKPASDRDDIVIVTREPALSHPLPDEAHGQALEVRIQGMRIFGLRSYLQLKEYYPKALLRILNAIVSSVNGEVGVPTVIAGDFNAGLDLPAGRDWAPPFQRLNDAGFFDALCVKNACDEQSLPCRLNHGKTFRRSSRRYRIDHLYVNRALAGYLQNVWIDQEGWNLSDHCAVVADFELSRFPSADG